MRKIECSSESLRKKQSQKHEKRKRFNILAKYTFRRKTNVFEERKGLKHIFQAYRIDSIITHFQIQKSF